MTNTIPLSALGAASEIRRDQWGRYLVVPPTGGKPEGYTRATTVAKALDSGGGLAPWKATMAAGGIIMRRGLRAQWEALLAEHGDPWYANEVAKAACKKLVEDCAAVGGANDRKEMGSSLHTITALIDLGRSPQHLTEETERDVQAYMAGRDAAGIAVLPGAIELVIVLDDWKVAGTLDRIVTVPGFDLPLIADIKTGASLDYSWHPFAVQLAIYSRANAVYAQGAAADGSQDQRLPMPAVDQHHGLIFWLNAGTGRFELHVVDLDAGWEAFQHSMWTRGWRNSRVNASLEAVTAQPQPTQPENLEAALAASLAAIEQTPSAQTDDQPETSAEAPPVIDVDQLRDWLQGRINTIGQHPEARKTLGVGWPQDIPTLRASDAHTPEQLAVIESLLDDVERRWELQFPPPKPGESEAAAVARVVSMFPGSSLQDQPTDKEPA